MSYITKTDCELDTNLSDLVTDTDIAESDIFFESFVNRLGVYTTEIKIDPLPIQCVRLIRLWVYCEVCKRSIGQNINKTQDGYETDWYEAKLKQYEKSLSEEQASITPNVIHGISKDNIVSNETRSNTWERA